MEMTPGHQVVWLPIRGGTCLFGDRQRRVAVPDLEWTATPVTWAQARQGSSALPLTGLAHEEAVRLAAELGGRLPRSSEWEWAAAGPDRRLYPWGDEEPGPVRANLRGGAGRLTVVGTYPDGATPTGLLDMGGTCWEWTSSPTIGDGYVIRGGSYNSLPLYARCTFLNAAPAELGSPGIGVRVVRAA
ncbi:SUMF1/EgtB/PvdO family nonheme iron enzyme [Kitasatospora sp. NPDC002227]|uniref:formylglycine-generating enzyme family protein n=1 Tax=Kitasatospora sp. NPDC002227 TaxID=3154773 RepID=UPI00332EF0F4